MAEWRGRPIGLEELTGVTPATPPVAPAAGTQQASVTSSWAGNPKVGRPIDLNAIAAPEPVKPEDDVGYLTIAKNAFDVGKARLAIGEELKSIAAGQATPETFERLANLQKEIEAVPVQPEFQEFAAEKDPLKAVGKFFKAPVKNALKMGVESMVEFSPSILAGAAGGAVGGALGGPLGSAFGAAVGTAAGTFPSSASAEFWETLGELGVDRTNAEDLRRGFADSELIVEAQDKALKRAAVESTGSAAGAGVAGRLITRPAASLAGKLGQVGAETGAQLGLEGGQEYVAQKVTGENDPAAVVQEVLGGTLTNAAEVAAGATQATVDQRRELRQKQRAEALKAEQAGAEAKASEGKAKEEARAAEADGHSANATDAARQSGEVLNQFAPATAFGTAEQARLAEGAYDASSDLPLQSDAPVTYPEEAFEEEGPSPEPPDFETMWSAIIRQESGGRQHDAKGNPLRSSAGATGVAQVMPETGKYVARKHGIPWDEERFRNDAGYNDALGRLYYQEQLQRYSNPLLAAAAYNTGPGNVNRALRKGDPRTGGVTWEQFLNRLPKETQGYVAAFVRRTGISPDTEVGPETILAARGPVEEEARAEEAAAALPAPLPAPEPPPPLPQLEPQEPPGVPEVAAGEPLAPLRPQIQPASFQPSEAPGGAPARPTEGLVPAVTERRDQPELARFLASQGGVIDPGLPQKRFPKAGFLKRPMNTGAMELEEAHRLSVQAGYIDPQATVQEFRQQLANSVRNKQPIYPREPGPQVTSASPQLPSQPPEALAAPAPEQRVPPQGVEEAPFAPAPEPSAALSIPEDYRAAKRSGWKVQKESQGTTGAITNHRFTVTSPDGRVFRASVPSRKGEPVSQGIMAERAYGQVAADLGRPVKLRATRTERAPAVEDEIRALARTMAPHVGIETPSEIKTKRGPVGGSWDATKNLIRVAMEYDDPKVSVRHEVVHALRDTDLFTGNEWKTLEARAADWRKQFGVDEKYEGLSEAEKNEEAIAEAFAQWKAGKGRELPPVKRLFARIRDFLQRLANGFQGRGFRKAEDVFRSVETGEIGRRERVTPPDFTREDVSEKYRVVDLLKNLGGPTAAQRKPGYDAHYDALKGFVGSTKKPFVQRARELVQDFKQRGLLRWKQALLDQFASINALMPGNSAYIAMRMTQNLHSVMATALRYGPLEVYTDGNGVKWFRPHGDWVEEYTGKDGKRHYRNKPGKKGFENILKRAQDDGTLELFKGYAVARRGRRLKTEKNPDGSIREKNMSQAEIDMFLDLENDFPYFRQMFDELQDFNKAMVNMSVDAGILSRDLANKFLKDNDYVPFYRIIEDEVRGSRRGKRGYSGQKFPSKRLKGGMEVLNDPIENMVMNMTAIVDRSFKNMAMQKVADLAEQSNAMERTRWEWWTKAQLSAEQVSQALNDIGINTQGLTQRQKQAMLDFWVMRQPTEPDIVSVMVDGKPQYYRVNDPLLLQSIMALNPQQLTGLLRLFGGAKRLLTRAITLDPAFMLANAIRDTFAAWVSSGRHGALPGGGTLGAAMAVWRENADVIDIMASGGGMGGFYRTAPEDVSEDLADHLGKVNKRSILNTGNKIVEAVDRVGRVAEGMNRMVVYENAIKAGRSKFEASYEALDLMDFSLHGASGVMQFMIQIIPFMNARVQGLYRLARGARANPRQFLLRGILLGSATLALMGLNWNDERYKELTQIDRDLYWHLFVGGSHFRIPKPHEVGVIFGSLWERAMALMLGRDDAKDGWEYLSRTLLDTFALNPIPQLVKPLLETYFNYNMFTDRNIVPDVLKRMPVPQQAYWNSSFLVKQVAEATSSATGGGVEFSPLKAEHLLRGYLGELGMMHLAAADAFMSWATGQPSQPNWRIDDMPVAKRFMRADPARGSRFVDEYYDIKGEVEKTVAGVRALMLQGDVEEAREMMEDAGKEMALYPAVVRVSEVMTNINKQMRYVGTSRTMTSLEKRRAIDALIVQRNDLARRFVEMAPKTAEMLESVRP